MFQSIQYIKYGRFVRTYMYNLVDSDFATKFNCSDEFEISIKIAIRIAKEYEKRKLNAPLNLALMYQYLTRINCLRLDEIIEYNYLVDSKLSKQFYDQYLDGIKKYMLLL